jgi:hypothetical protein
LNPDSRSQFSESKEPFDEVAGPDTRRSLIGSSMLGIREIDRQLNAIRECE